MSDNCYNCERKLNIINYICKCGNRYCKRCRFPENHSCEFNYKDKTELNKKLIKVEAKKI